MDTARLTTRHPPPLNAPNAPTRHRAQAAMQPLLAGSHTLELVNLTDCQMLRTPSVAADRLVPLHLYNCLQARLARAALAPDESAAHASSRLLQARSRHAAPTCSAARVPLCALPEPRDGECDVLLQARRAAARVPQADHAALRRLQALARRTPPALPTGSACSCPAEACPALRPAPPAPLQAVIAAVLMLCPRLGNVDLNNCSQLSGETVASVERHCQRAACASN